MAPIQLPVFTRHGIGAAFIPRASRMHAGAGDLLIVARKGEASRQMEEAMVQSRVEILNTILGESTVSFVARPPSNLMPADLWKRAGLTNQQLQEREMLADSSDRLLLLRRFRACTRAAGLDDMVEPRLIGTNLAGSQVYETIGGRVALNRDNEVHYERDRLSNGKEKGEYRDRFFRAISAADITGCAAGVARSIATGARYDARSIATLFSDMVATPMAPDLTLFAFQEEIEAALVVQAGRMVGMAAPADYPAGERLQLRDIAVSLMDGTAAHATRTVDRQRFQQYSTPLTIAAVAAEVLQIRRGDRVLEPTIGNGALAIGAALAGAQIEGFEIDPGRAARAGRVLSELGAQRVNVRNRAFHPPGEGAPGMNFDVVLANPPFESIRSETVQDGLGQKLALRRLDHKIVFESLEQMGGSNARAFLVLPGEMMDEGELDGARRDFHRYLSATYEMAGAAVLDGRLYRKSGAEWPVIVYALGPRRASALPAEAVKDLPTTLPVLQTTDALFMWADLARERLTRIRAARASNLVSDSAPELGEPATDQVTGDTPYVAEDNPPAPASAAEERPAAAGRGKGRPTRAPRAPRPQVEEAQSAPMSVPVPPPPLSAAPDAAPDDEREFAASPDMLVDDVVIEPDAFQVNYESASRVGGPLLKIQRALAEPVAQALADLERRRGPIDEFVANQIGVNAAELGSIMHAGQVDGVGLALHRSLDGQSAIIGDLMGVGKGRQLAALARAALRSDRPVMFFTDNPGLFSDFVARDLAAVMQIEPTDLPNFVRPYIFNTSKDAHILDPNFSGVRSGSAGFIFKAPLPGKQVDRRIDSTTNLVLSSYSQLGAKGREAKYEAIVQWLRRLEKPPLLIMDESHRAAGEGSNVGTQMTGLVEVVRDLEGSVVYSSGTPLKGAKNLKVYGSALPDVGMPADRLVDLIEREPLALQEALSYEMARSGALISRELDNSAVERETISLQDIDPVRYVAALEKVDAFASHMAELLKLGREIKDWAGDRRDEIRNEIKENVSDELSRDMALASVNVHYQSPASRFHHLSNYLTLSINGLFMEDLVLQSIAAGRKPVISVANTGDALMQAVISNTIAAEEADGEEGLASLGVGEGVSLDARPHMGDVIKRMADRLLTVRENNGFGVVEDRRLDQYEDWLEGFNRRVDESDLSMLSLSVIDDVRVKLAQHGLETQEITRRAFTLNPKEDGGFLVTARPQPMKQDVVSAFNNGRADVLILNQSAAVGLSAQSSPANGFDVRRREMIKAQMQADVAQERQMDGRINRVGQLHPPLYTVPLQGLASSDRLAQLFNRKNRSLTATSTATRENESNIKESLDLLNEVGQRVSLDYLVNNPDIALALDIDVEGEEDRARNAIYAPTGFSEKLMGRMIALPTSMQRAIMSELDTAFQVRVGLLDAMGENPLRLREHDWKATVTPVRQLVGGVENAQRMSERPLVLNKVEYLETVKPLSLEQVGMAIERGRNRLIDEILSRQVSIRERLEEIAPGKDGELCFEDPIFDRVMNRSDDLRSLGATERNSEEAATLWASREDERSKEPKGFEKMVLDAGSRVEFLHQVASWLEPGMIVTANPSVLGSLRDTTLFQMGVDFIEYSPFADADVKVPVIVADIDFNRSRPLNLGDWTIKLAVPGEARLIDVSLAGAFAAHQAAKTEQQPSWIFAPASHKDSALGMVDSTAGMWSPMLAEALEKLADGSYQTNDTDPPMYGDRSRETAMMEAIFDNISGGKVTRSRYTIEGNLFAAVSALAGKKMGEKAMYTDAEGAIRHCFLLKKDGEKKLLQQLEKNVANRAIFIKAEPIQLETLLASCDALFRQQPLTKPEAADILAADLRGRLVAAGYEGDRDLESQVEKDLDSFRAAVAKSVRALGYVNSGIFVGSDPFGDSSVKNFQATAAIRVREMETDASSTYLRSFAPGEIGELTRAMSDRGAFIVPHGNDYSLMVTKVKNNVCSKEHNGLSANWTNQAAKDVTVRHQTVGARDYEPDILARFLFEVAKDHDNMVGLRGAYAVYSEEASRVAREYIAKIETDPDFLPVRSAASNTEIVRKSEHSAIPASSVVLS